MSDYSNNIIQIETELKLLLEDRFEEYLKLSEEEISVQRNTQERNVRQILGHMIDSASNNIHRIIHLQYRDNPVDFPDYANKGVNEIWIRIQNYEEESWIELVYLWKYIHLHFLHIIKAVDLHKLQNVWISALGDKISLEEMIMDFPRHFQLHLSEIKGLLTQKS